MFEIYWLYYILGFVMIPGIILGIYAEIKVYSTFEEFNKVQTRHGETSKVFARKMLDYAGLVDTQITHIDGELTDNYNPKTNTVSLSDSNYNSSSIASIGVTAHEIGHVFQHKDHYLPIKLRNFMVPVMNLFGWLAWPLVLVGLILEIGFMVTNAFWLIIAGIAVYGLNTLFCLITLPIELNASKRAYKMLTETGEMDEKEAEGVKKVLNAAALTYVAALITSALSLVRLLLFVFSVRGKRN